MVQATSAHDNWHCFRDTGNDDLGNLADHGLDVAHTAMGFGELPDRVQSMGANFVFSDTKVVSLCNTPESRYTSDMYLPGFTMGDR
jgi:hypothetical protein